MLGDKIREARKKQQFTLNQLAEASNLTASYISQVERNLAEPSISSLRKIAAVLQMPLYQFLDDDAPQTQVIRADKRKHRTATSPMSTSPPPAPAAKLRSWRSSSSAWPRKPGAGRTTPSTPRRRSVSPCSRAALPWTA